MKCLTKDCKNRSLLMTVELCYPCSQLVEKGAGNEFKPDWDTVKPFLDRIAELDKGCAECGVKASDDYALYCVKCSEAISEQEPLNLLKQSEREGWRYANELVLEIKRLQELTVNREWVGLTDEEIIDWWESDNKLENFDMTNLFDFARAVRTIQAKLKEKNSE